MSSTRLHHDPLTAIAYVMGSSICFATMNLLAGILGRSIPSGQVATVRMAFGLLLLAPIMYRRRIPFIGTRPGLVFVRGSLGFASLACGFYALTKIPLAEVSVLWKSSVVFTAALGALLLRERVTAQLLGWIALALLGAACILKPTHHAVSVGGIAALCAGFFVSIVAVSIRKLHETEKSETIVFGFCLWGTLLGLMAFGYTFVLPTVTETVLLLLIGVAGIFGQTLFTRAYIYAPASTVQPFTLLEVLVSALFGVAFLGQVPDLLSVLGGSAIIVAALGALQVGRRNVSEI